MMPIRRLSMTAQVKKTHSNPGKGRMGPGRRGRPRKDELALVPVERRRPGTSTNPAS
jgi:hypothetical protein